MLDEAKNNAEDIKPACIGEVEVLRSRLESLMGEVKTSAVYHRTDNGCYFLAPRYVEAMLSMSVRALSAIIHTATKGGMINDAVLSRNASRNFRRKYSGDADILSDMSAAWLKYRKLCHHAMRATSRISRRDRRVILYMTGVYGGDLPPVDLGMPFIKRPRSVYLAQSRLLLRSLFSKSNAALPFAWEGGSTPSFFFSPEFKKIIGEGRIGNGKQVEFYEAISTVSDIVSRCGLPLFASRIVKSQSAYTGSVHRSLCGIMHETDKHRFNFMAYIAALARYGRGGVCVFKHRSVLACVNGLPDQNRDHAPAIRRHPSINPASKARLRSLASVSLTRQAGAYFTSIADLIEPVKLPLGALHGDTFSALWPSSDGFVAQIKDGLTCMRTEITPFTREEAFSMLDALTLTRRILDVHRSYAGKLDPRNRQRVRCVIRRVVSLVDQTLGDLRLALRATPKERFTYSIAEGVQS